MSQEQLGTILTRLTQERSYSTYTAAANCADKLDSAASGLVLLKMALLRNLTIGAQDWGTKDIGRSEWLKRYGAPHLGHNPRAQPRNVAQYPLGHLLGWGQHPRRFCADWRFFWSRGRSLSNLYIGLVE